MLNCMKLSMMERQIKVIMLPQRKNVSLVLARFWLTHIILYLWLFYANSIGKTLGICKGDYSATSYGTDNLFYIFFKRKDGTFEICFLLCTKLNNKGRK